MSKNSSNASVTEILKGLDALYPDAYCALTHRNAFELTAATILSAQCTDERVNQVTPKLFARYPTPAELAQASMRDVEEIVKSTGFYKNKARNLIGMAQALVRDHASEVPKTVEELIQLPGVGRKTANVVLGNAFHIASGVVVDTHVRRLSYRLGLSKQKTPEKIERDLMKIIPKDRWVLISHQLIFHGRRICVARKPKCEICTLARVCPKKGIVIKKGLRARV